MIATTDLDVLIGHGCPEWCARHTDWRTTEEGNPLVREHIGPRFGCFVVLGEQDWITGETTIHVQVIDLDGGRSHAERLRQVAADAAAAAEWVDAHS